MSTDTRRIVDARLRVLRARVDDGIATSFAPLRQRSMVMVELRAADGLAGYGESWVNFPAWAPLERVATLREGVFPLVVGENADDVEGIHSKLRNALGPIGRQWGAPGPIMQAISAVDMALWDLRGKAAAKAISRIAGNRQRDRVPIYASGLGPAGVAEDAGRCRRAGHTAVKVRVGFGRERDEAILAAARDALGAGITLYADANQAWTMEDAVSMAPVLAAHDVAWIEEPVAGNRLEDLERLHRSTGLVIATGENVYGLEGFRPYAESPAVAVLQPDVAKTGGITEMLAIVDYARSQGKSVMPHLYGGALAFAASLQVAACVPIITAVEYDVRANPLRDPLIAGPPRPGGGYIPVPDEPGLGIRLDMQAVRAYRSPVDGGDAHSRSSPAS